MATVTESFRQVAFSYIGQLTRTAICRPIQGIPRDPNISPAIVNAPKVSQIEESPTEVATEKEPAPALNIRRHGNHWLASFMSTHPEVGIFKRFGDLNAYNLLALQSELTYLRDEFLEELALEEAEPREEDEPSLDCNMRKFSQSSSLRWERLMEIRSKLNDYNSALKQQIELNQQPCPTKHNLNILQCFLSSEKGCDNMLRGLDSEIWDDVLDRSQFIAMSGAHSERDIFSGWFADKVLKVWHQLIAMRLRKKDVVHDEETGFTRYDDSKISTAAHILCTFLSSFLVTVPMIALYAAHSTWLRIGLIMIFTVVFSLSLAIFTKARSFEIFGATAAFAAVQVVFVGSVPT